MGKKLTIEEMHKLAEQRGGKCLSMEYINAHTKLKWQCAKGHIWEAIPSNIKSGHWCQICFFELNAFKSRLSINEMYELAEQMGGKCLSRQYVNAHIKLKWQCAKGHIWEARPDHIKSGHWCPICAGVEKSNIKKMHKLAEQRGGKCLSTEYINAHTKLKWQCADGHIWEATYNKLQSGRWCPICQTGIGERICRRFFEIIFKKKFPKTKFKWLINNKGNQMELDGYNKELNLAFEYQGRHHYEYLHHFHKNKSNFKRRMEDDKRKKKLCQLNGIVLIEVPYTINYDKMQNYLIEQCKAKNIDVPEIKSNIDYKKFDIYSTENLKEMKKIAKAKGGKCLSTEYINARTKLKWQCKKGHIWEAIPDSIKRGSWCRKCAIKSRSI